jgi:hypothetical protein
MQKTRDANGGGRLSEARRNLYGWRFRNRNLMSSGGRDEAGGGNEAGGGDEAGDG